ncbi:A disintegrin and metalloproteinase with thrombospondin motifs 6 [Halyomorpha halys]|uniref:A disintegrin and metalloproteinase with thrombospondin motifs 6 n=1 Tax=Halyomorpha halys TaxID=286706 RepID=UPI000D0C8C9E|nr:A disintegrin and metalloproteinase with thrombospondin motifs 7 [Halyomorpha halys]
MIYFQLYPIPVQIVYVLSVICFKESFSIQGKYTKNLNNYKIVYPVKVSGTDQSSRRYRRWHTGEESTVHYQLNLGGNEEWLDLEPNLHILSPGAVLERRTNITSDNEPLANVLLEQPSFTQCFFKGKVRNYNDSSTALSTCRGLCGFIRVKRKTYFIEPVEKEDSEVNHDQAHLVYEDEHNNDVTSFNCATKLAKDADDNFENTYQRKNMSNAPNYIEYLNKTEDSNSSNKRLHIETLLVMDQSMMDLHDASDLQNYALTVFNMAQSLFHDLSIDPPVDLEIVRIIEVEDPKDVLNFRQIRQGTDELDIFSTWQRRINPKDEKHPNHHDLAVLLTGRDICDEADSCHYVGLAESNGACRPKRQAAICKDTGLMLGYIIAHQIAHTLGVGHDSADWSAEGTSSVMSPLITLSPKIWTEQSRNAVLSSIKKRQLRCLEDYPASEFKVTDILPGVMYDADYQCQQLLTPEARSCCVVGDCQSLACDFEGTSCTNTGVMPAPGTSCGVNKWCFDGACLEAGKRPLAGDGNWGSWSEWSPCSRTCGAGVSVSTRECNSPPPMHGGKSCSGNRNRHKICTTEPCDVESHPFRDIQCAEYNDWVFPEDGEIHKWKGFFVSNGNPCALYCRNDKDVVVSLSPKVKDGTTCYRGKRDICVDGICRDIPCDLQFDSNSVEDACGICHGNGTGCKVVQGRKDLKQGTSQILAIPAGTRNIIVEETKQTPSHIILKTNEEGSVINEGNKLGMFNASGSMGWLGMKKPNQEILEIPGPVVEPLEIWMSSDGPQSVIYSMGLASEPRDGNYSWDYIDWSACMAQCGDSYQESVPKCVELLSGQVEDKYCPLIQKPPVKRRACNAGICLPRWLVGEWQECGPCPSKEARRFRIVRCVKPTAGSEEGVMIVSDKICPGSRPIGSEPCRCIKRQVLYWPSPYKFDLSSNDFKIIPNSKRGNKTSKVAEKKVTLMQLENESEESMLKQFRENQQKHHSIFYMPRLLGSRFNFSIPFKKREAIMNEMLYQESVNDNNFIDLFTKPSALDLIKYGNRIMGNNYEQTTYPVNIFNFDGLSDNFNFISSKRFMPASTNEPPPLNFSEQNILKLLSDNLPLDRLKQQHYSNRHNKNNLKNLIYSPEIILNDTDFSQPKPQKKSDIIRLLMNEYNNVLATNMFLQPNTKIPPTTHDVILQMQGISSKPRDSIFEKGIQLNKEPFVLTSTSGLDAAISRLQKSKAVNEIRNTSGLKNLNFNNLGKNNQGATENRMPSTDPEWSDLLNAFRKYLLKNHLEFHVKNVSKKFNDKVLGIDENFFLTQDVSTEPTVSNGTHDDFDPFKSLSRKVADKLNNLSYRDKLRAYQFFSILANDLHNTLSAFPQREEWFLNDDLSPEEIELMLTGGDKHDTETNIEKVYDFFNSMKDDRLRYNRSSNSVLNYDLPKFDKPIFSSKDLVKIKKTFHSGDNAMLVENVPQNDISEFYQLKIKNKQKPPSKAKTSTTETANVPESTTSNIFNHYLDEFIKNYISDLEKGDKERNKKETVKKLNPHRKFRLGRWIKECDKKVTSGRRITGVYDLPPERVCPTTTVSHRRRYFLQRCRKNIKKKNISHDKEGKMLGNASFEIETLFLPGKIKASKLMGKKKRHKPCEESTRICEELKLRFKDRLANVTKLDPYQCQRLREEIAHVKHDLMNGHHLEKDLDEVINSNATCIFRYNESRETTTPFHIK